MASKNTNSARKILVIGGSTYNENTPEKIRQAFIDSRFLDEWAVIIAIHQFFKLNTEKPLDESMTTIKSRLSLAGTVEPKIFFITELGEFTIETGYIYVLPDPGLPDPQQPIHNKYLYTRFIDNGDQLKICAEASMEAQIEFEKWLLHNPYDKSKIKREMTVYDLISSNSETRKNLPLLSNVDQAGIDAKAKTLKPEEYKNILYRDMPLIDKFMSEVADSKSKPKIAALLLCGRFGDGAEGLKKIKKNGGYTAVQFPGECFNDPSKPTAPTTASMPNTALNIEPNHAIVSLENQKGNLKLSEWLDKIK
ncbi:MAG TPA: chemotaxis protein CheB [Nostocaceae cyanobacterium]|nr:chemotaxis protein CheB [Nostocaceae cyanobacterium]